VRIKRLAARAGVEKRVWLHLFRHSQLTNLVKMGYSEYYLRKHAGWSANSKMAEVYVKLAFDDVEQKYYEINGIHPETKENMDALKPKVCVRCGEVNAATNKLCNKCLYVLDLKTALELEEKRKRIDDIMDMLFQRPKFRQFVEAELIEIEKERRASTHGV
jgi:ribosomal protein L40E